MTSNDNDGIAGLAGRPLGECDFGTAPPGERDLWICERVARGDVTRWFEYVPVRPFKGESQ